MTFNEYSDLRRAFGNQESGVKISPRPGALGGTAEVDLIFSKEGMRLDGSIFSDMVQPNPSLSKAKESLEVPLFWSKDLWGNWLLDGTKTFAGKAVP